jgi:hypothetical protein
MGSFLYLPARGAFETSTSLLCFHLLFHGECRGKGGPGANEYCATTGRLGLGLVGLENDALGLSALLACNRDNQLFLGLGQQRFWAETARRTFDRLNFGDGCDYLVDGSCSQHWQQDKPCQMSRNLLAGAPACSCTVSGQISIQEKSPTELCLC